MKTKEQSPFFPVWLMKKNLHKTSKMEKSHESYFSVTDCNRNFTVYGSIPVEKKEEKKSSVPNLI